MFHKRSPTEALTAICEVANDIGIRYIENLRTHCGLGMAFKKGLKRALEADIVESICLLLNSKKRVLFVPIKIRQPMRPSRLINNCIYEELKVVCKRLFYAPSERRTHTPS